MCRLWVEIPQEQAQAFIQSYGWATEQSPIAITISKAAQEAGLGPQAPTCTDEDSFGQLAAVPARQNAYIRRAGILATDPLFHRFIEAPTEDPGSFAASYIRHKCAVASRKEITPNSAAAVRFDALMSDYVAWRDGPRVGL